MIREFPLNRKEEDNKAEQAGKNKNNFISPKSRQRANRRRANKTGTERSNVNNTFEILDLETDTEEGHRKVEVERVSKDKENQAREGRKENDNDNEIQM